MVLAAMIKIIPQMTVSENCVPNVCNMKPAVTPATAPLIPPSVVLFMR